MQTTYFTKNSLDLDTIIQQPMSFLKLLKKSLRDSGQPACGFFLDLQKASLTVNHDILLKNSTIMELLE